MLVILWTDALIFLLIAVALSFAFYASHHPHLAEPWRQVGRSRVAAAALVVLGFYVVIGLLDSVHFHPRLEAAAEQSATDAPAPAHSTQILSLLDLWLTPLRERGEKTFSAPFATHLFVKEPIEQPDGSLVRTYPRLKYGGVHLDDPEQGRGWDIVVSSLLGLIKALIAWTAILLVGLGGWAWHRRKAFDALWRSLWQAPEQAPWRVALWTLLVMLAISFIAGELALNYHILGTDKVGEDVFYQSLKSVRTGLVIGTLTTLVMLPAAVILGIMAGYFRGLTDDIIQYLYTTLNSIPGVLLIAAAILMLQVYMTNHGDEFNSLVERADLRLLFLCIILGVTSWTGLCRLLRGEALKLREADYVQAATALGVRHSRIIARHILPNVLHIVMIAIVLDFSGLVLAEAVLSYVNIGVDPTMNSWGNMINSARLELARDPIVWWSLAAAFVFMFTLVLAANLLADVVRDAFDPRLRNSP
ncbi:ABC transporter permease [Thiorhodovibrio frisius]|uniref:ABC-type dipeptide/oligopeptide/nickel transport system, permease component n=1 Tax=Thiorhodovibrio frisius TaxID=631362 RepID=H8YZC5_9GAMM|nr:ABC transporter permease [Thiorhodovibrio frisius]EIC22052.1 ABC-type dipeptide/oligopeptide/nickel transport system, permease component [Thiorhodovibrio frisius]WPL24343.1 Stage 0 sporulation protein KC [Thiorhodovibrio frisius]